MFSIECYYIMDKIRLWISNIYGYIYINGGILKIIKLKDMNTDVYGECRQFMKLEEISSYCT